MKTITSGFLRRCLYIYVYLIASICHPRISGGPISGTPIDAENEEDAELEQFSLDSDSPDLQAMQGTAADRIYSKRVWSNESVPGSLGS